MATTIESIMEVIRASEQESLAQTAEFDRQREEVTKEMATLGKKSKGISNTANKIKFDWSDILEIYVEAPVKKRIKALFAERSIVCNDMCIHHEYMNADGTFFYEIDILIYSTTFVIAIKFEHQLKKDDVDDHLERLGKCLTYPPSGTEGKIILGALATMIVSAEVERYARRKGFYVIKPSGESVKIANNMNFKARPWQMGYRKPTTD